MKKEGGGLNSHSCLQIKRLVGLRSFSWLARCGGPDAYRAWMALPALQEAWHVRPINPASAMKYTRAPAADLRCSWLGLGLDSFPSAMDA